MKILKFPDKSLFTKCEEVLSFDKELKTLLDAMWETMTSNNGMGLAANQVGLKFRMFVMLGPSGEKLYLVNPKIHKKSIVNVELSEGCLSAPGEPLTLGDRAAWVVVDYRDENGLYYQKTFKDIYAVCVQHEIDHLDGKSYLESPTLHKARRKELAKKWKLSKK